MNFIQPLFLAGLLAAALPLVIHLINRRKAVNRPFPALRLLRESNEKIARSIKIRQWLLLALRILAIALLAVAIAKPYVLSSSGITAEERLPTSVIFVVENGFAMDHGDWWEKAVDETEDRINDLRPWDEAGLVTTADDDAPLAEPTTERSDLRRALDGVEQRFEQGSLADALLTADNIVSASQLPNRRIVVIGSGTDSAVDIYRDLDLSSPVEYVSVGAEEETADNLAITDVEYEQQGAARDGRWQIDTVVENFGTTDREDLRLQLRIDDEIVTAENVDIAAGESITHSFEHHIERARLTEGVVELRDADELDLDNRWHFLIRPRHRARALIVNGSPSSISYDDELFFLSRALEPDAESGTGVVPSLTTPDGLDRRNLDDFDVVFLANVSRLSPEQAADIQRFVEDGGGLFISMGGQVDHEAYNNQFGDLLPRPLRGMKRLAERDDPDAPVKITSLGHPQRQHPIFQAFGVHGGSALQTVSVYSYMLLDPAPAERETELILSYQDNAPALLERRVGQGRVLLFTSTIDRDWTDLPVRSAYLPLMNRSLLYLARRATSGTDEAHLVGDLVELDVSEFVSERAIIRDPQGRRIVLEPDEGQISFTPRAPGTYSFFADDDEDTHLIEPLTISANIDRSGSNLESFSYPLLDKWQGEGDEAALSEGPSNERRLNLWSFFLFIVTLALLAETVLGARRSVLVRTAQSLAFWRADDGPVA